MAVLIFEILKGLPETKGNGQERGTEFLLKWFIFLMGGPAGEEGSLMLRREREIE